MAGDWTMAPARWKNFHAHKPLEAKIFPHLKMTQLFRQSGVGSGVVMKTKSHQPEESWESDPVWQMLGNASTTKAGPRFADNTLRVIRTTPNKVSWWKQLFAPGPITGLGTAATLTALAIAFFPNPEISPLSADPALGYETEEITEIESLITSIEQVEELSDSELIALIGY